jgi:hypothetical protein
LDIGASTHMIIPHWSNPQLTWVRNV